MTDILDETNKPLTDVGDEQKNAEDRINETINEAEEVVDILDGLVERTEGNAGAPFEPDVVEQLIALKNNNLAAFEKLRAELKKAGCRITALDKAMKDDDGDEGQGESQADILTSIVNSADLFHAQDDTAFADIEVNGHRETWPVRSKGFKRWLTRQTYKATGRAPSSEALQTALNLAEAKAQYDAPKRQVFIRVGGLDDKLYLDLCNDGWQAIEISSLGWRVIDDPPVRFRRTAGMKPLPIPQAGGTIDTLRSFLNVESDSDFVLIVCWALAVLRNRGPYPVIVLSGEQGSAKSTFAAILRSLVEPNTAALRTLPRENRDMFIAANNSHVLAFDNVSSLSSWTSDTLCRLATGGGFAVRQLYTDGDEVLFEANRPIILNGIEDFVTRPDLADRSIDLTLEPIPEEKRRPEGELWEAFEAERPRILGALLDAVVQGLKMLPRTKLEKLPRMADFALWATACEMAFWPIGTFRNAYDGNRDQMMEKVIESDSVAAAIHALIDKRTEWSGTATELLAELTEAASEGVTKSKAWPKNPQGLSGRLRRAATFLRKFGIKIAYTREGRARTRIINISATGNLFVTDRGGIRPSAPSASSADTVNGNEINGSHEHSVRTVGGTADDDGVKGSGISGPTVCANTLESNDDDNADGADASIQSLSGSGKIVQPRWKGRI